MAINNDWLIGVNNAIEAGVGYLNEHQYPNGEFCCYIAPDDAMQEWCTTDSCTFASALIASSLLTLSDLPKVGGILEKTNLFLQYQMMRGGVWNFFTVRNPLFRINPPDIDATVIIASLLRAQRIEFPDPKNLLLANRNAGGLFYTWFAFRFTSRIFYAGATYWKLILRGLKFPFKSLLYWTRHENGRYDVDGVVNANVLYYFGPGEHAQPIVNYLLDILHMHEEATCDKWYRTPITYYYFLSRNFNRGIAETDPAKPIVIDRILSLGKPDGQLGNSILETALGISSLINAGYNGETLEAAIAFLLSGQQRSGYWPRWSFYYSGPKKMVGWGSEELTTAICLEALAAFRKIRFMD